MGDERRERPLPIRALHEFLFEISNEWDRFRTGSLLNMITTLVLIVILTPRYFLATLRRGGPFDTVVATMIIIALIYNLYLSYRQHGFYRKWEKRMGLLLHLEEEILGSDV